MPDGRFAPSPTGDLHLGNLRTALVAWLAARSADARFLLRMEDLDPAARRRDVEEQQRRDLAALGLDWDGPVVRQSERLERYRSAIDRLVDAGLTYPCYCTRREIRAEIAASARAPHGVPPGAYPGTCRDLSASARAARQASGRPAALRLRCPPGTEATVEDSVAGRYTGQVDDLVLARADGTPSYNLAVVVDDASQGVGEVVRGDDLLPSTPRQVHLAGLLDLPAPLYTHVPLVLGPDGERLAKRHGAVTLRDLRAAGTPPEEVRWRVAASLGLVEPDERPTMEDLVRRFDRGRLPRTPWRPDVAPAPGT